MKKIRILFPYLLITIFLSCQSNSSPSEKHQKNRDIVVDVHNDVKEIITDDVLIGSIARLSILDNFLIIADYKSNDMLIHLFNNKTFEYLGSAIPRGQGPTEITNIGHIGINNVKKELYVSDHGKLKIFTYPMDSIINNSYFAPNVKTEINNTQFPSNYEFINDTLTFARMIEPTGNSGYNEFVAKWNMESGELKKINYSHPEIKKKRISFTVSIDNDTYVECYSNYDLMTILDLNGNLKCNVYGRNWNRTESEKLNHFGKVIMCEDKIIASYSGGNSSTDEYFPTQLMVFSLEGEYIKTLKIGYRIADFCYDKFNRQLIFNFDDTIQFGYIHLLKLLE